MTDQAEMGPAGATENLSFEEALKRLEEIVNQLERGDVPLDKSIDLYAEGDRLRAQCQKRLDAARAKIDQIRVKADGSPGGTTPFGDA
tara:strand:- start:876 stop:1139 length:264 start_codon:yes stop_codon:yes gene_type:complete